MDFVEAIKRPFTDIKKWLIGVVLMILPVVNFLSIGYILESGRMSLKHNKKLPEWKNWGTLFVDGLLAAILGIIYMIPAFVIGFIALGSALLKIFKLKGAGLDSLLAAGPFLIIAMLIGLLAIYLLPAATLNWLKQGRFRGGFSFGMIFKKAFSGKYFVAWIISTIINIILTFIFIFIPFVGSAIAGFTGYMISYTLLGEAFADA